MIGYKVIEKGKSFNVAGVLYSQGYEVIKRTGFLGLKKEIPIKISINYSPCVPVVQVNDRSFMPKTRNFAQEYESQTEIKVTIIRNY